MSATSQSIVTFGMVCVGDVRVFPSPNETRRPFPWCATVFYLLWKFNFGENSRRSWLANATGINDHGRIGFAVKRAKHANTDRGGVVCRNGLNSSKLCLSFDVTFLRLANRTNDECNTVAANRSFSSMVGLRIVRGRKRWTRTEGKGKRKK